LAGNIRSGRYASKFIVLCGHGGIATIVRKASGRVPMGEHHQEIQDALAGLVDSSNETKSAKSTGRTHSRFRLPKTNRAAKATGGDRSKKKKRMTNISDRKGLEDQKGTCPKSAGWRIRRVSTSVTKSAGASLYAIVRIRGEKSFGFRSHMKSTVAQTNPEMRDASQQGLNQPIIPDQPIAVHIGTRLISETIATSPGQKHTAPINTAIKYRTNQTSAKSGVHASILTVSALSILSLPPA
jgi:hypothetical protein